MGAAAGGGLLLAVVVAVVMWKRQRKAKKYLNKIARMSTPQRGEATGTGQPDGEAEVKFVTESPLRARGVTAGAYSGEGGLFSVRVKDGDVDTAANRKALEMTSVNGGGRRTMVGPSQVRGVSGSGVKAGGSQVNKAASPLGSASVGKSGLEFYSSGRPGGVAARRAGSGKGDARPAMVTVNPLVATRRHAGPKADVDEERL